jgi:hypothetical protein
MIAPSSVLGNGMARRVPSGQSNQAVDCAEALKHAALLASGRTFAVVACPI